LQIRPEPTRGEHFSGAALHNKGKLLKCVGVARKYLLGTNALAYSYGVLLTKKSFIKLTLGKSSCNVLHWHYDHTYGLGLKVIMTILIKLNTRDINLMTLLITDFLTKDFTYNS
jgi:hypothetical protein